MCACMYIYIYHIHRCLCIWSINHSLNIIEWDAHPRSIWSINHSLNIIEWDAHPRSLTHFTSTAWGDCEFQGWYVEVADTSTPESWVVRAMVVRSGFGPLNIIGLSWKEVVSMRCISRNIVSQNLNMIIWVWSFVIICKFKKIHL